MFYDELYFINVAQNMYYHQQYGTTLQGDKYKPEKIAFYYRPGGHPFLINLFYLLFGESEKSVFLMNPILGALSVVLIFLFTYAIFNSVSIAFWASLFVNIFPVHLKYSACASSEVSSFFFVSLALFAFILFNKFNNPSPLYLLTATTLFSSYIRPENALFLIPLIVFFIVLVKDGKLPKKQLLDLLYFIFVLVLPLLIQIVPICIKEAINAKGRFWSLRLLQGHILYNAGYLFSHRYNFISCIVFSLFGIPILYRINRVILSGFMLWFLVFFIAYSGYFMGYFSAEGDGDRYFFLCIIPLSVFAAVAVKHLLDKCNSRYGLFVSGLLLIIFVSNSFTVTKRIYETIPSSTIYRECAFLKDAGKGLPDAEYVLTMIPFFVTSQWNKKALDYPEFIKSGFLYPKMLLLKGAYWKEEDFLKEEEFLKKFYDFKILAQKKFSTDSRTFIAELTKKKNLQLSRFCVSCE